MISCVKLSFVLVDEREFDIRRRSIDCRRIGRPIVRITGKESDRIWFVDRCCCCCDWLICLGGNDESCASFGGREGRFVPHLIERREEWFTSIGGVILRLGPLLKLKFRGKLGPLILPPLKLPQGANDGEDKQLPSVIKSRSITSSIYTLVEMVVFRTVVTLFIF